MSHHNLEIFFHMKNHYKKLEAVKCVVDTGRSRLEQHSSKSAAMKNFRKKKRVNKADGGSDKVRTLSDSRPQTRRNLSDVPSSQQNRSQSMKRQAYKHDKKKHKQLSNIQFGSSTSSQRIPDKIESDSLNNTDRERIEKGKIETAADEATSSVFPKSEIRAVKEIENISNNTTSTEKVGEVKDYTGYSKNCINDHEYSQFLLRITEDIIRNEYYTMDMILNVFKSHIEANKSHLDLGKMLLMIKQLCSEINFPIEIKEIDDCDENEQCSVCYDYSCENVDLNCVAVEPEQKKETVLEKCENKEALPQNSDEVDNTKENNNSTYVSIDGQTKIPKCLLSEKLRLEVDEEYKTQEKCEDETIVAVDMNKEKMECESEQKTYKEENTLPVQYVTQLENCLKRMETLFTQISQANVCQPQTAAICNVPPDPTYNPGKFIKNSLHQTEQYQATCNMMRSPEKHYCTHCQMRFHQKPDNKNELPTTYPFGLSHECNKRPVKSDVKSKDVTFGNLPSVYLSDTDCTENVEEAVEVIKLPPKAFVDESCIEKNSIYLISSSCTNTATCDSPLDTNKAQYKGTKIQTDFFDETKTTVKDKKQRTQRAVGIQWGKCSCLNNKCNQTVNNSVSRECSALKIVPKTTDASTQYAKIERDCPSTSENGNKKIAKEPSGKADAFVQYEKETDKYKKSRSDATKHDIEENSNSRKEKFKICIKPSENNGWNSKIVEYKTLLQDLFTKCENQCAGNCGTDFRNVPQRNVKESVETNFNRYNKNCENGTSEKGYYNINEYKSMLQDLFERCNIITRDETPKGKVHQATNAKCNLPTDNYEIKACQKSIAPIKSHCTLKTTKEEEIYISPVYENWPVSSKDAKFSREVAHQYPQLQEDFHVTVMHDAFTSMSHKQLLNTYCNPNNRICDKRENFLLGSTYEKNNHKQNPALPLTLAAFFPSAETQTTDIDRHLATRLIMSIQAPTKEEVPKNDIESIPEKVEEVSQNEMEEKNETEESLNTATKLRKGSLKPDFKDRRRNSMPTNRMVSVGTIEEVQFAFENDMQRYRSEPLSVHTDPEDKDDSLLDQGIKTIDDDLKINNGGSGEIKVENTEEELNVEENVNEPDDIELKGKSRKSSGGSTNKQIEQTEKQDESILSDESEYNCCGRKKINLSDVTSRGDRSSTRGSSWNPDKQATLSDASASHKNVEMQQITRDGSKQEPLKKGNMRLADKYINLDSIKKRFDRRSASLASDEQRIEQIVKKTFGEKAGKDRTRAKSHYIDEENLELVRTRSKKRNTLMVPQDDRASNES